MQALSLPAPSLLQAASIFYPGPYDSTYKQRGLGSQWQCSRAVDNGSITGSFQLHHGGIESSFARQYDRNRCQKCIPTYQPVSQLVTQQVNEAINKSINMSITLSVRQSAIRSINQSISQSTNPSINQKLHQPVKKSINQSKNPSIHQSINQPINESINRSTSQFQSISG